MEPKVVAEPVAAVRLPIGSDELSKLLLEARATHREELEVTLRGGYLMLFTKGRKCGCAECLEKIEEVLKDLTYMFGFGMIVCETCGNKRCPHADSHRNLCTGSNEFGQVAVLAQDEVHEQ